MSFLTTPGHTHQQTSAPWPQWPRTPAGELRLPAAEPARTCHPLCQLARCPANFSTSGGIATGTEVAERLRDEVRQPVSLVAHWIVGRNAITFSCGARLWLPLFQFDFAHGCLRVGVAPTMAELVGTMSDNEVASWFSQPNAWLHGQAPADVLISDVGAVLAAARAHRLPTIA